MGHGRREARPTAGMGLAKPTAGVGLPSLSWLWVFDGCMSLSLIWVFLILIWC